MDKYACIAGSGGCSLGIFSIRKGKKLKFRVRKQKERPRAGLESYACLVAIRWWCNHNGGLVLFR